MGDQGKKCPECGREFKNDRHKVCPSCRKRDLCACGKPKRREYEKCTACTPRARSENGNWKGGRSYHKKGYVMIAVEDTSRGRYVFEHILVMEQTLGRRLEKDENVHHKNGVKDDNRPGNLELWVRPQPSGIRAEDAVLWAREILKRYEHLAPVA